MLVEHLDTQIPPCMARCPEATNLNLKPKSWTLSSDTYILNACGPFQSIRPSRHYTALCTALTNNLSHVSHSTQSTSLKVLCIDQQLQANVKVVCLKLDSHLNGTELAVAARKAHARLHASYHIKVTLRQSQCHRTASPAWSRGARHSYQYKTLPMPYTWQNSTPMVTACSRSRDLQENLTADKYVAAWVTIHMVCSGGTQSSM